MISILMPIYNGIEFLCESYESVKAQTLTNWELLIGINGHEENSDTYQQAIKIINNDNRVKIIDLFNLKSKASTLNNLVSISTNQIICLLDVDDKWHNQKLEYQLPYIQHYDIVGTNTFYFGDRNDKPYLPMGLITSKTFNLLNPIINSSCMMWKRDAYWDESLDALEDYDLWLRLNKQNKKFFNLEEVLCYHRIHNTSFFNTKNHSELEKKIKDKYFYLP